MKNLLFIFSVLFVFVFTLTLNAQWAQTSGPTGGMVITMGCNGSSSVFAAFGSGVFRSTDNGGHWKSSGLDDVIVGGFFFKGNYVFATDQNGGLWRSGDNGNSWTNLNIADLILSFTIKGNYIFTATTQGIMRSSDYGNSWLSVNEGLSSTYINALASNNSYIFAGGFEKVYRSSNNGTTWNLFGAGIPVSTGVNVLATIGSNLIAGIGIDGVYRSTDNGANWSASGLPGNYVTALSTLGNSFFAKVDNGIYRSDDFGLSWELVNNDIVNNNIVSMSTNTRYIFVGMGSSGISRSGSNGDDWRITNKGLKCLNIVDMTNVDNDLYACSPGAGIYYSKNSGTGWTDYNIGLPSDLIVNCLGVNRSNYKVYAGTSHGIYYTSPTVDDWTPLNSELEELDITSLAVKGKTIYAGEYREGVYKTTNGGLNWVNVIESGYFPSLSLGTNVVYAVQKSTHGRPHNFINVSTDAGVNWTEVIDFIFPNVVNAIAAKGNSVFLGNTQGIYRSTNKGLDWTIVNNGLSDSNITALYFDDNKLVAGTQSGMIFNSSDNGSNWISISEGLLVNKSINCLASNNNYMFAGQYNNSIWSINNSDNPLNANINQSITPKYALGQNKPNPFNPVTKINYSIQVSGFVSLKVYDVLGREIIKLVNEYKTQGDYTVNFDGSNLNSGVYFYKLTAPDFSDTKRMVLIK